MLWGLQQQMKFCLEAPAYWQVIDYKIEDGEEFHARDVLNSIEDPTLYSAISALNTLQIEILVLRCIGSKTFREIGELVEISELHAKDIYFNTLTKLRKIIGEK